MFNRESSFEGSRTKNQYNCCVQSTCFFQVLDTEEASGSCGCITWLPDLERNSAFVTKNFFGDFFEAKICPADSYVIRLKESCFVNAQIGWKDRSFLEGNICSCTMLYLELACEDIVKENGDTVFNRLLYWILQAISRLTIRSLLYQSSNARTLFFEAIHERYEAAISRSAQNSAALFWTNPKCYVIRWLILFLRLWKQDLATVWKELFKKDDAYSSRDLMHSHDILRHFSDARSEKMANTAVTPTWRNRAMRCDPRWPEEGLSGTCQKVVEFSTHNLRLWFILRMIRYCTYVKSWCFQDLGIPEDFNVEMLFQSLQPTPGRFTACFCIVYWVFWLVSIGIKCNVMRSERHLIFVGLGWHVRPEPSNFKPDLGKLIRSFKFLRSAFFWFVGGYLDLRCFAKRDGHFCFQVTSRRLWERKKPKHLRRPLEKSSKTT